MPESEVFEAVPVERLGTPVAEPDEARAGGDAAQRIERRAEAGEVVGGQGAAAVVGVTDMNFANGIAALTDDQ